jgi:hypothetical protein
MRKISKTRFANRNGDTMDIGLQDAAPLRIPGATITAWSDSLDIDLEVFFSRPASDATVAGTGSMRTGRADHPTGGCPPTTRII